LLLNGLAIVWRQRCHACPSAATCGQAPGDGCGRRRDGASRAEKRAL